MVSSATAEPSPSVPATLCDVAAGLAAHGPRAALIDFRDGRPVELSYAALGERILDTALRLHAAGVGRGSCVAIWAPNSAAWVIGYFGAVRAGATVVPIDQQAMPTTAAEILEHAGAALLLTTDAHRAELHELGRGCETLPIEGRWEADANGSWPAPTANASELPAIEPDDVAALLYTSGTTGVPKAVPLTHRNLTSNAVALTSQRLIAAHDRVLLPLPLHHTYPFTVGLVTALLKRAAVVFPAGISGPEITGAARAAEATALLAVPRLCEALWESVRSAVEQRGERAKKLFYRMLRLSITVRRTTGARIGKRLFRPVHEKLGHALDLIGCGGAKLDPELAWRLEGLGWTVLTGYGLTETSPVLTFNDRAYRQIGTEGRPLPGVELDIRPVPGERDPDAPRSAHNRVDGEIVARGPSVFSGYWHDRRGDGRRRSRRTACSGPAISAGSTRAAFCTSSAAAKSCSCSRDGKKIFPEALEKHLRGAPLAPRDRDSRAQRRLVALVVPDEQAVRKRGAHARQAALLREELEEHRRALAPYQRIRGVPRTPYGAAAHAARQAQRHLLPELYDACRAADARSQHRGEPSADRRAARKRARDAAWGNGSSSATPTRRLTLDTSPQLDLHIDSLEWVAITIEIEQRFGVALTGEALAASSRVRDLLREIGRPPCRPAASSRRRARRAASSATAGVRAALLGAALSRSCAHSCGCYSARGRGHRELRGDEPLVITPNHASYLDPARARGRAAVAAAPAHVLGRLGRRAVHGSDSAILARALQVFPVDPDRDLASAIDAARDLMRRG